MCGFTLPLLLAHVRLRKVGTKGILKSGLALSQIRSSVLLSAYQMWHST